MVTVSDVLARFMSEAFAQPLMDNALRGYWCEAMVAEALGPDCRLVAQGWHPWDLEIGDPFGNFPDRIRIQVKNSAQLQSWNQVSGRPSEASFSLKWRHKPGFFERDNPGVPCEVEGFLCDLFILCHHPEIDPKRADHRDPKQWGFYLLPVVPGHNAVTANEVNWLRNRLAATGKPSNTQRRPETLANGIRGRQPIRAVGIDDLTIQAVRVALGV
jgi:hypothetical protein